MRVVPWECYCLESDFNLTWVQIKIVVRSLRFTQLAIEHVHLQPKVEHIGLQLPRTVEQ